MQPLKNTLEWRLPGPPTDKDWEAIGERRRAALLPASEKTDQVAQAVSTKGGRPPRPPTNEDWAAIGERRREALPSESKKTDLAEQTELLMEDFSGHNSGASDIKKLDLELAELEEIAAAKLERYKEIKKLAEVESQRAKFLKQQLKDKLEQLFEAELKLKQLELNLSMTKKTSAK